MPRPGIAAPALSIIAVVLLLGLAATPAAMARQEASPAAGTPVATTQPTQAAAQPAQTPAPAATPAAVATTDVVTFVYWYANSANQDILEVLPLVTDAAGVAGSAPGAAPVGTVDFPEDGSPPTIIIGETTFTTYPRPDGVIERWTWVDDFEGARPATLVMQVSAQGGNYQDYFGTATLVSRDEGGAGGVLVLALRPPAPAGAETPVAETPAAEAAPAEDAAAAEGASGDVGTTDVIEVEPAA
jgi:hypothetical protein